jgi:double-stranded uracil-DNA glycosylase
MVALLQSDCSKATLLQSPEAALRLPGAVCERSRMPRPTRAELEAARSRTVPDLLPGPGDPPVGVLFCGINPGLVTALTGHHFGRPGNRFWPALHLSGFTPRRLLPAEQGELPALGLGITNMAGRATARADELTPDELRAGGERLRELVATVRPRWVAVVGITAYRVAFDEPRAAVGPQDAALGGTRVWLLPNPSGLNAHWQLPELAAEFGRLRAAATP